jgi:hypothetical protein
MGTVELRKAYLRDYPECQYSIAIGRYVSFRGHVHSALAIEHIWNRKGPHSEHWSNYATVCPAAHDWKHARSVEARIGILWYKHELAVQSGDERHFDLEALRSAAGLWVPGWIEAKVESGTLPPWAEELGRDLLERIS